MSEELERAKKAATRLREIPVEMRSPNTEELIAFDDALEAETERRERLEGKIAEFIDSEASGKTNSLQVRAEEAERKLSECEDSKEDMYPRDQWEPVKKRLEKERDELREALVKWVCQCDDGACGWNNGVKEIISPTNKKESDDETLHSITCTINKAWYKCNCGKVSDEH